MDAGLHGRSPANVIPYAGSIPCTHGRLVTRTSGASSTRMGRPSCGSPTPSGRCSPRGSTGPSVSRRSRTTGRPRGSLSSTWWRGRCRLRGRRGWHPHQANEAGWPWERDWRASTLPSTTSSTSSCGLVERGLMPCIVGMWGYCLNLMGIDRVDATGAIWSLAMAPSARVVPRGRGPDGRLQREARRRAAARRAGEQATDGPTAALRARHRPVPQPHHDPSGGHRHVEPVPATAPGRPGGRSRAAHGRCSWTTPCSTSTCSSAGTTASSCWSPPWSSSGGPWRRAAHAGGQRRSELRGHRGLLLAGQQRFQFWTASRRRGGFSYGAAGCGCSGRAHVLQGRRLRVMEDAGGGPWEDVMHLPGSEQVGLGTRLLERYPWSRFTRIHEPGGQALGRLRPSRPVSRVRSPSTTCRPTWSPSSTASLRAASGVLLVADAAADPVDPTPLRGRLVRPSDRRQSIGPVEPTTGSGGRPPAVLARLVLVLVDRARLRRLTSRGETCSDP